MLEVIRKAIPIIGVTWILSLVTTLALVYFIPIIMPKMPKTWHEIELTGNLGTGDGRTSGFLVPSDHWRISWIISRDTNPLSENTEFDFRVYKKEVGVMFQLSAKTASDFDALSNILDGFEYVTGSGRYDIRVTATAAHWLIGIQAYY